MESRSAASGDDLQHPWVDNRVQPDRVGDTGAVDVADEFDDDDLELEDLGDAPLPAITDDEVLLHAHEQSRAEVERRAERVYRLAADRTLFEAVVAERFDGRRWLQLGDELAGYGWAVMDAWMRTGYIFTKVNAIGRPMEPSPGELTALARDADARTELCLEIAAQAVRQFRAQALSGTGWHPDGGANLTTFFVGGCVLAFNNEFRRWRNHERSWGPNRSTDPQDLVEHGGVLAQVQRSEHLFADPERATTDGDHLRRVLGELNDVEQVIVAMTELGYSQEEIGEVLDISERAVEGRLYRLRQKDIRARVKGQGDGR